MNGKVRAPELDSPLGWLNTDRPLRLADELRGQVVVLDFWTYCCINCMHILPDLAFLEDKYASEPVMFVGVHSAKFANEASRETIRAAILRYEIRHPVVIDDAMRIWRSYAVRSWPTLVVIDPQGYAVFAVAGEGNREVLDNAISEALSQGRKDGVLAGGPLTVRAEASVRAASGLKFPGKVYACAEGKRLFVADSNHNRIVIASMPDAAGRCDVVRVVGTGAVGRKDGPADEATFDHPQGLVVGQGKLYVADTENHLLRAIDLESFEVTTIVGTGEMSNDRAGGAMGAQQGLNSPWDLAIEGATLYVAMAGTHQIWRIDMPVGFARALAGSGRENLVDGPAEVAALAQPSGICLAGGQLYFADSEVSAIRGVDLAAERVFTLIGEGLFTFGDVDGPFAKARLQHPLGIDAWGSALVVADTYNHKIKLVDLAEESVRTLRGTGEAGATGSDGGPAFFEPGGLSVAGDEVFVADTNNHRIVRMSLVTNEWHEIAFENLAAPSGDGKTDESVIDAGAIDIAADRDIDLVLDIKLPNGAHLSAEAPWSVSVRSSGKRVFQHTGKSSSLPIQATIPSDRVADASPGESWRIDASFAYCTDDDRGVCIPAQVSWQSDVRRAGDSSQARYEAEIA